MFVYKYLPANFDYGEAAPMRQAKKQGGFFAIPLYTYVVRKSAQGVYVLLLQRHIVYAFKMLYNIVHGLLHRALLKRAGEVGKL